MKRSDFAFSFSTSSYTTVLHRRARTRYVACEAFTAMAHVSGGLILERNAPAQPARDQEGSAIVVVIVGVLKSHQGTVSLPLSSLASVCFPLMGWC